MCGLSREPCTAQSDVHLLFVVRGACSVCRGRAVPDDRLACLGSRSQFSVMFNRQITSAVLRKKDSFPCASFACEKLSALRAIAGQVFTANGLRRFSKELLPKCKRRPCSCVAGKRDHVLDRKPRCGPQAIRTRKLDFDTHAGDSLIQMASLLITNDCSHANADSSQLKSLAGRRFRIPISEVDRIMAERLRPAIPEVQP